MAKTKPKISNFTYRKVEPDYYEVIGVDDDEVIFIEGFVADWLFQSLLLHATSDKAKIRQHKGKKSIINDDLNSDIAMFKDDNRRLQSALKKIQKAIYEYEIA